MYTIPLSERLVTTCAYHCLTAYTKIMFFMYPCSCILEVNNNSQINHVLQNNEIDLCDNELCTFNM